MLNLFITLSIVFFLYELTTLFFTKRFDDYSLEIGKKIQSEKLDPEDKPFMLFNLSYFIWTIIGLFTEYNLLFFALVSLSIVSAWLLKKLETTSRIRQRRLDAILSIIIISSIFIQHFVI